MPTGEPPRQPDGLKRIGSMLVLYSVHMAVTFPLVSFVLAPLEPRS